jgi:hypothetical protein
MYDTYAWLFFLFSVLCRFDEKERIQKKSSKVTLDVLIVCFYHLRKKKSFEIIMDNPTPRTMRRVHRNIFKRLGESLGKLEQNISQSSSNLSSRGSQSSFNSVSENNHLEDDQTQDDSVSLKYYPNSASESPKAILNHRHGIICFKNNSSLNTNSFS